MNDIKLKLWELIPYMDATIEFFSLLAPLSLLDINFIVIYGVGPSCPNTWCTYKHSPWLELLHSNWNGQDSRIIKLIEEYSVYPDSTGLSNNKLGLTSPAISLSGTLDMGGFDLFLEKYNIAINNHPNLAVNSTPLMETAFECDTNIVQNSLNELISRGIDLNGRTRAKGETCLHLILNNGKVNKEALTLLLSHGIDLNLQNSFGDTPIHYLIRNKLHKLLPIFSTHLLTNELTLTLTRNNLNFDPLHEAIYEEDSAMIAFFSNYSELTAEMIKKSIYLYIICSNNKWRYRKRMRQGLACRIKHGLSTETIKNGYLENFECDINSIYDIVPYTDTAVKLLINSYFYRDNCIGMPNNILDREMRRCCKRVCNRKYRKYNIGNINLEPINMLCYSSLQILATAMFDLKNCNNLAKFQVMKTDIAREWYALIKVSSQFQYQNVFEQVHRVLGEYFNVNVMALFRHRLSYSCSSWEEIIAATLAYLWLCNEYSKISENEVILKFIRHTIAVLNQFPNKEFPLISTLILAFGTHRYELCVNIKEVFNITSIDLIPFLLDCNQDINKRGCTGLTALHIAIMQKNDKLVHMLIARGADVFAVDYYGTSCVDFLQNYEMTSYLSCTEIILPSLQALCRRMLLKHDMHNKQLLVRLITHEKPKYINSYSKIVCDSVANYINLLRPYEYIINI